MALKEINGSYNGLVGDLYHQIHNVTGINFDKNPNANIRKRVFSSEDFRKDNPDKPLEIDMENFMISAEAADKIKAILYQEMKLKKTNIKEIKYPAETDDNGEVIKEAWIEETFDSPYADMIDC